MSKWLAFSIVLAACGSVHNTPGGDNPDGGAPPGDTGSQMTCTATTCASDMLTVCAAGVVDHTESCALGCFSDQSRCNNVTPSNGLAAAFDQAAQQPAVTLPAGSVINSDTGGVMSAGTPIAVTSTTVTQSGGPTVRVLLAKSWTINGVRISGSLPVAFVATDDIKVQGAIDASADGATGGPGAQVCGAAAGGGGPAQGFFQRPPAGNSGGYPAFIWSSNGLGGGGFGTAGGAGGVVNNGLQIGTPGAVNGTAELVPLRGGCEGGADIAAHQGSGGGAVQLVSGKSVHLVAGVAANGTIHVGGGGGVAGALGRNASTDTNPVWGPGGGGSGGGILIEAPSVTLDAGAALLAGGGGAGGWGACTPGPDGGDAPPIATAAAGGVCPVGVTPASIGGGGAVTAAGTTGGNNNNGSAGSGGGGIGRIRINTATGQYTANADAVLLGVVTAGMVGRR